MKPVRVVVMAALCGGLAGCNLAPDYRTPEVAVPARFPGEVPADAVAAQHVTWQQFFGDAQLKLLIAKSLELNQDLAAATARIEQAGAFYRIERANQLPHLDAGAAASRNQAPLSALDPALAGSRRTVEFSQFSAQLMVTSFELDFWGRVRNMSESALQQYLATIEGQRAFRLSLIANVASTYYDARAGEEGIALAQRTVETRSYAMSVAKDRLDAGVTSLVDYEQSSILLTQAQTQLAEWQRTTAAHWNRLWVLVGENLEADVPGIQPIEAAGQFDALSPGLPSSLLVVRPDIRQAENRLRSANANIGAARAALFPRIALTGSFGYASPELSDLFSSPSQIWNFGGGIGLPIFDFGQRRAAVDLAMAQRDELVANYKKTVQTAFSEVATALESRKRFQEQVAAQETAIQAQRRLAETADLRYQNGISIYLEVVDARRGLFSAEQQMLSLRAAQLQNGVSLYVALGGGDEQEAPVAPDGLPATGTGAPQ
ncbi:efflux transporter outer membrane subunit [Achromobacter deleyi]|uniref:efflux transporter outer membrane subunit n=1 Tax=Achromobacter deleyi TaxID=1353891 RepID=UPI00149127DE|nr:efflux transporter outer membrane subunit [Achromobacter deleyi]QVQ27074.1 efflux transporter outer membrane subunit [Achromobacter deleyi]UIP22659.1 efflux transporter outer membrane subunit [Achromobacter deleyi]